FAFLLFLRMTPGRLPVLLVTGSLAAVLALLGFVQARGWFFRPAPFDIASRSHPTALDVLWLVIGAVVAVSIIALAVLFQNAPFGHWDALAMFNGRAAEMFRSPGQWRHVFDEFPHADYPLSLSILIFTGWTAVGH